MLRVPFCDVVQIRGGGGRELENSDDACCSTERIHVEKESAQIAGTYIRAVGEEDSSILAREAEGRASRLQQQG